MRAMLALDPNHKDDDPMQQAIALQALLAVYLAVVFLT